MELDSLFGRISPLEVSDHSTSVEITALAESLEDVVPGALFFCVRGSKVDGHDLAAQAVERGAIALVVEEFVDLDVPQAVVADTRAVIAFAAVAFNSYPAESLTLTGVTGTNGKTTVTHMLSAIYQHSGRKAAALGTLSGVYTTPPAILLQQRLREFVESGFDTVAMEVSSAGLVQHRLDGLVFDVAIFTNLTQDHLDYHGTMEAYFQAKAMLFDGHRAHVSVINADDPYGKRIIDSLNGEVLTYSLSDVENLQMSGRQSQFVWRNVDFVVPLAGDFNVLNALAAATAANAQGITVEVIAEALETMPAVPGRLEAVPGKQPFDVVVDFAHTPDGLDNVLSAARQAVGNGRLICVMGCGGDRDADKRPKMAAISERIADVTIVTSDNPRSEDPEEIIRQVVAGLEEPERAIVEVDRKNAIEHAIRIAEPGDFVLIAGKGHESTQEIAGVKHPFDDRKVALEAIHSIKGGSVE